MKAWLRRLWNWSWVVTLPVAVFFGYWLVGTWRDYAAFGIRFDTTPMDYRLADVGRERFQHGIRQLALLASAPDGWPGGVQPLRTISLFVPDPGLATLNSELPHSGFEFVDGRLWNGVESQRVSVRYRGDYVPHWGYPKKSLRIKTRKNELFEGMRQFNLVVPKYPEQLNNHLGYRLAHEMGLMGPRSELVEVTLNGRNQGLHVLVEQLDETTLRSQRRMPGDFYSGELVARDGWRGIVNAVWEHPELWDKIAVNNHYPVDTRAPLQQLARLANAYPIESVQAELSGLLDMDAWGRFAAFETLTQCLHYDHSHNWRLFYDSNRVQFEPAVWDPVAWAPAMRAFQATQLEIVTTRLHALLMMNGDFLRARQRAIVAFFESDRAMRFRREIDRTVASIEVALSRDPNVRPLDFGTIEEQRRLFLESIDRVFEDVERSFVREGEPVRFAVVGPSEGGRATIGLEVHGRRPIHAIELNLVAAAEERPGVRLRFWRDGFEHVLNLARIVETSGRRVRVSVSLLAEVGKPYRAATQLLRNSRQPATTAYYELVVDGLATAPDVVDVTVDRGVGRMEAASRVDRLERRPLRFLYRVTDTVEASTAQTWSGSVEVRDRRRIDGDLRIEPGTVVRLSPGASIVVRGRLAAEGTEAQPIRFEPAAIGAPWGALALQGRGADGSVLRHCRFSGGSGWMDDLFEYSAMLSIHDAHDVRVSDSSFRDGKVVDDMVHAVYSTVVFERCEFRNAPYDALDLDICTAEIVDCSFIGSGHDGVDLMTTRCAVAGCRFEGNGDKGISVGEDSRLLAVDSRFLACNTGVEAKDGSAAMIYNAEFADCGLALNAYKKNWRYADGGRIELGVSRLRQNRELATADDDSSIRVFDSYLDRFPANPILRIELVDVDGEDPNRATAPAAGFPDRLTDMGELAQRYWARVQHERRGPSDG